MHNFKCSIAMVLELCFFMKKKKMKMKKMKNLIYLYFIPFSSILVTFLHVPHLDVLRRQIEIETNSKTI